MNILVPATVMIAGMVVFIICFALCLKKKQIPLRDVHGPIVLGNTIFFENSVLSNIAVVSFVIAALGGVGIEWLKHHDSGSITGFSAGLAGFLFLVLHCRCFPSRTGNAGSEYGFLRELFFTVTFRPSSLFLWLSRASYGYFLYKVTFS